MKRTTFLILLCLSALLVQQANAQMFEMNPRNKPRFDRGITRETFVPKGQWIVGGAFSYSENSNDNYKFLVLDGLNGNGYTLKVSPFVGYFIKDNMALGARFAYKRTFLNLDKFTIDLGDDLTLDVKNAQSVEHVYYGTAFMRNYVNLGSSKRFGLFNETRVTLGGGQGKMMTGQGETFSGTYQDIFELQVGIAPGLTAFVTDYMSAEVSVGVLGFNYKNIQQVTNQVETGHRVKSAANFKVDLFSINIGVAFYLPNMRLYPKINFKNPKKKRDSAVYHEL